MTCEVCGHLLGLTHWRLDDGRRWCGRHADAPTCRFCGFPVPTGQARPTCARCADDAVSTSDDIAEHRRALRAHMDHIGLLIPAPTQILLAHPGVDLSVGPDTPSGLGRTRWSTRRGRLLGPITIQIAGGLPGHLFRRTLAHEFGHAAIAGGTGTDSQPLQVLEGFAECVSLEHLQSLGTPHAKKQIEEMLDNPDPLYGDGLRLVRPWVETYGLVDVAARVRSGSRPPVTAGPPR